MSVTLNVFARFKGEPFKVLIYTIDIGRHPEFSKIEHLWGSLSDGPPSRGTRYTSDASLSYPRFRRLLAARRKKLALVGGFHKESQEETGHVTKAPAPTVVAVQPEWMVSGNKKTRARQMNKLKRIVRGVVLRRGLKF